MNKPCKKNAIFFNITSVVADAYAAEIRAFVECIVEDRPVPVTGADARAATPSRSLRPVLWTKAARNGSRDRSVGEGIFD